MKTLMIYRFRTQAAKATRPVLELDYSKDEIRDILRSHWLRYKRLKPARSHCYRRFSYGTLGMSRTAINVTGDRTACMDFNRLYFHSILHFNEH